MRAIFENGTHVLAKPDRISMRANRLFVRLPRGLDVQGDTTRRAYKEASIRVDQNIIDNSRQDWVLLIDSRPATGRVSPGFSKEHIVNGQPPIARAVSPRAQSISLRRLGDNF